MPRTSELLKDTFKGVEGVNPRKREELGRLLDGMLSQAGPAGYTNYAAPPNEFINGIFVEGVITLSIAGELRQGTPASTGELPANFTGLRIWNDSQIGRLTTYNAGVVQVEIRSDGGFYAGAGALRFDQLGLTFTTDPSDVNRTTIKWETDAVTPNEAQAKIWAISSTSAQLNIDSFFLASQNTAAIVQITGNAHPAGTAATIRAQGSTSGGGSFVTIEAVTINLNGAVNIGGTGPITTKKINLTDATNQIVFDSDGVATGTLTWTPATTSKTITLPNLTGTVPLGTGTNTHVAYWSGTNSLTGSASLTWNGSVLSTTGGINTNYVDASTFFNAPTDSAAGGFRAGSLLDVLWYWGGANTWRTPDSVIVDGTLTVGGATTTTKISLKDASNQIVFDSDGAATGTLTWTPATTSRTITLPNLTGTVPLGTGTNTHVAYWSGTNTLTGSANMTFNGSQLALAVQGATGGLLIGTDAALYRNAANVLYTPDSFTAAVTLNVGTATATGTGNLGLSGRVTQSVITGARAYHSVNQSVATGGSGAALALDSESWDTDTIHDLVTNNTRLTCKTAGKYLIIGIISYDSNATGVRSSNVRLNGTTLIGVDLRAAVSGSVTVATVSAIYDLVVNDYVELIAYQTSGGPLNVLRTADYSPVFHMVRIA